MANQPVKITVTGAAGQIGYALLFRIASGQMLGDNVDVELQLLELEAGMDALHGIAMELDDCAFPLLKNITCTSDVNIAMRGSNWVIFVGSVPRKAGMERSDLLKINGGIFTQQGRAMNDHAASDVRAFVVGNPCNTNCLIAMEHASDIPNDRFFAMTALDELRARNQLAKQAGVDITAVKKMAIWGNHSATQYPDFYHTEINGQLAKDVIDEKWLQGDFISTVQQRGAAIIKARGASSAASAANATITSIRNLTRNTASDDCFSIAKCSNGEYETTPGLIFSFPCHVENGQLNVIEGLEHNAFSREKIATSHAELISERDAVKALKLI